MAAIKEKKDSDNFYVNKLFPDKSIFLKMKKSYCFS